jgi:hypothetical protein
MWFLRHHMAVSAHLLPFLRNLANEVVLEVAGLGLMHLDAIAQEKGFVPTAVSAWSPP